MNDWMDAEQRIERAQQLCESRRWDEALEEIDQALEINAANGSWWNSKGYLLDHLGRYEEAIQAYEAALECEPNDRDTLAALGLDCIRAGQLLRAIQIFEHVQRIDSSYEPAYCHRIMLYAELGEHDLAEEMFYLAQQIDECCPHCFWHLGCSLWMRDDLDRAIWCWRQLLEIEPSYRGARRRLAEAYRRQGDFNSAREHYLAEYREDPGNPDLLIELGTLHLDNGQVDEALTKFKQVLELDPQHARALELIGDAHGQSGLDDEAVDAYRHAARLADVLPGLQYKLGNKLMKLGSFDEAKACFASALEQEPSDRDALMAAGNCALELGDPNEAQERFERLLAIDDCLPGAYHNLAVCHFLRDNYEEGIVQCQRALELKDDYALARHKLVLANIHLGRWSQARQVLDESLETHPTDLGLLALRKRWNRRRAKAWAGRLLGMVTRLVARSRGCPFSS